MVDIDSQLIFSDYLVRSMIQRIGNEDANKRKYRERFETLTEQRLMARYGLEKTLTGFSNGNEHVIFGDEFLISTKQGNVSVPSRIYYDQELSKFVLDYVNAWIRYYS